MALSTSSSEPLSVGGSIAGSVEEQEEEEMDTLPTACQDQEQSVNVVEERVQAPLLNQLVTADVLSINDEREEYIVKKNCRLHQDPNICAYK